jgi:hypothetical protein
MKMLSISPALPGTQGDCRGAQSKGQRYSPVPVAHTHDSSSRESEIDRIIGSWIAVSQANSL